MTDTRHGGTVLVAIPTLGRRDLRPALEALAKQAADVERDVEIVVLDNSGAGAGVDVALVDELGAILCVVPSPGLSTVRNAAIDLLGDRHGALVFLDDDECPADTWLRSMLDAQTLFAATVVVGPVHVRVPANAPSRARGCRSSRCAPV